MSSDNTIHEYADIERRFDEIDATLSEIKNILLVIRPIVIDTSHTLTHADETIAKVAAEVMPTINELMQSPMLKMLGVGKKK